jgi:hypothetical protein
MTDDELEDLLDGMNPRAAAELFRRTSYLVETEEFAAVLIRLAGHCAAYSARIEPSPEA